MGERGVVYRCTVCGEQYDIRGRVWLHVEAVHRDIQRERINDHIVEEKAPGQDEEPELQLSPNRPVAHVGPRRRSKPWRKLVGARLR
jgi:hypothetical protein